MIPSDSTHRAFKQIQLLYQRTSKRVLRVFPTDMFQVEENLYSSTEVSKPSGHAGYHPHVWARAGEGGLTLCMLYPRSLNTVHCEMELFSIGIVTNGQSFSSFMPKVAHKMFSYPTDSNPRLFRLPARHLHLTRFEPVEGGPPSDGSARSVTSFNSNVSGIFFSRL